MKRLGGAWLFPKVAYGKILDKNYDKDAMYGFSFFKYVSEFRNYILRVNEED